MNQCQAFRRNPRQLFFVTSSATIYLGRTPHGDATSGDERSTLVIGPSRSGKTSSLIIPNLLLSTRTVVVTSTKPDVLNAMANRRSDGATLLFDPSGTVPTPRGVTRIGYSPVNQSNEWDGAVLATRSLVDVARRSHSERSDDHWTERAFSLVAPLIHATALRGESLGQLATVIDQRHGADALDTLRERYGDGHPSVALLQGIMETDERERSGIWSTASGLFAGMRTDAARAAARGAPLDVDEFLRAPHQLHIVAPSRYQAVSTPLIVGMIEHIVHATYDRHADGAALLLALDELANVAPLPRLASIVSEGGGQGVLTLACLQDLSQARARWGPIADGFLSLFPTTVVLPGVADRQTLELLQRLAGRSLVPTTSIHRGRRRSATYATSWVERDRATIGDLATGRPGWALGIDSDNSMRWIALTPAHHSERFRDSRSRETPARSR